MENFKHQDESSITIESWVNAWYDKLYSWALYKTNSKETAEDLVQETFLSAFQSLENFKEKSGAQTWLFGILNHKIADHFRKVYRQPVVNESDRNPEAGKDFLDTFFDADGSWVKEQRPLPWPDDQHLLDDMAFKKCLQNCMNDLPVNWNAAINLKYLEGKKGEIICQELEITPTNFWQILHRGKLQLRKCLNNHWFKK